ncbi:RNA polymerase II transcription factor B subunit 4 [Trapelia coarctata]|nr:RNA polymerase II transcription factor B subunit 4 [Trapelia coarctata]
MDTVDGSEHYEKTSNEPPPSLLTVILDTNPHAWSLLSPTLTLSQAVANILVFINAHLAFNNANKVAVIASHIQRAEYLYPPPAPPPSTSNGANNYNPATDGSDVEMSDAPPVPSSRQTLHLNGPRPQGTNGKSNGAPPPPTLSYSNTAAPSDDANIYRPFHLISLSLFASLSALLASTPPSTLSTPTTALAGALTLALSFINKQTTLLSPTTSSTPATTLNASAPALTSRILVVSVSTASPTQYIPFMNTIFAAQRMGVPIDILSLAGSSSFLQQASDATNGTYVSLPPPSNPSTAPKTHPPPAHGLLPTLLLAFLPDATARTHLIAPTQASVDFRAACFCHRKIVDVGFVCSICLSIFCEPPEGALCLTCGTHLRLGEYGRRPVVVARRRKKKRGGE